jgi:DNA invertase Pin-like site-specific DNA recombinase
MNNTAYDIKEAPATALIYCRVSSKKQKVDGTGLQSQEHRCLAHAAQRRYAVEKVFLESVSGGLDIAERPAMTELLRYLDSRKKLGNRYVVIFDDNKRFARQTEVHIKLRRELEMRGARVEYLNFMIEDSPEGTFIDTMLAAQAQLEREQIGRQTKQKTRARLERGYWTFRAPVGYKYVSSKRGGKELVIDQPLASIVKEALEGFASCRFATQAEVKRFLESQPSYPKDMPNGELRTETVARLMRKVLYAGYLEAPEWNIARRKANHEGIISLETFERVQSRRDGNSHLLARKDIHQDFVMRGAV